MVKGSWALLHSGANPDMSPANSYLWPFNDFGILSTNSPMITSSKAVSIIHR